MNILTNLRYYFDKAPLEIKKKILGSIFPLKLTFEDGKCRTKALNPALSLMLQKNKGLEKEKPESSIISEEVSGRVLCTWLEPSYAASAATLYPDFTPPFRRRPMANAYTLGWNLMPLRGKWKIILTYSAFKRPLHNLEELKKRIFSAILHPSKFRLLLSSMSKFWQSQSTQISLIFSTSQSYAEVSSTETTYGLSLPLRGARSQPRVKEQAF